MAKNLKRILTGIQSTGVPHMGNILGAILPAINFSKQKEIESYLFIADFHSLTQIKDSKTLKENTSPSSHQIFRLQAFDAVSKLQPDFETKLHL